MDHAPLPDDYLTDDRWHASPLTDDEREALRDEIRQVVLGIREESHVGDVDHDAIDSITLTSLRDEDALTVTVSLLSGRLETRPVGDETFDAHGDVTASGAAHYLRDLGDEWDALEYDLVGELVLMLDLPELPSELAGYLLDGEAHGPCLFCTTASPGHASFSITAHVPGTTRQIYDDAEFELARLLGIPIDGGSE
jgi:hypothetical protein